MKSNYKLNRKSPNLFWKLCLSFVILLVCKQNSIAQTVIIPATNAFSNQTNEPLGAYYGYQRTAMIYTAAELGLTSGALIKGLYFYYNSFQTPNSGAPVIIRISNTTQTTFNPSLFSDEVIGATTVVTTGTNIGTNLPASSWFGYVLSMPFVYTGGNLKVTVETNATGTGGETFLAKQFRWSAGASQSWKQDNTAPTGLGVVNTSRPNIYINYGYPPTNDSCATALGFDFFPYTNSQTNAENATNNAGFLGCSNPMNDGVWYTFYGTGGNIKVSISNVDATFDPQVDIYSGLCGNLACVASADVVAAGGGETILFDSVLNTLYYVNVAHFSSTADLPEGNFTIKITDERPSQFNFITSEFNYGYENQSITLSVSRDRSSSGITTVGYSPNDGSALGNIDYGTAFGTLTWADGDSTPKNITIQLLPDAVIENLETFTVLLINPTNGATVGTINDAIITIIDKTAPPINDACSGALNAVTLPYSNVQTRGQAASNNNGFMICEDGMNDGLWYRFTGNGFPITVAITNVDASFDPELFVYNGACSTLFCTAGADAGATGQGESLTFPSVLGTNYIVNVGYHEGNFDSPEGNFKIDITTTALANNNFDFQNIKVFPNPFSEVLNIENSEKITKISITNILGQEVKNITNPESKIDVSDLEIGVYLLKMQTEMGDKIIKITKK